MKFTESAESLAGYKALILYIMNKVNRPINNEDLLRLIISFDNMNYFYFQQFLLDLIENKYVSVYSSKDSDTLYSLTESGKKDLPLLVDLIPGLIKFKVDCFFKDVFKEMENSYSIIAEFFPNNEKDFDIKCKIIEKNKTIFEIQTFAGSIDQAKLIAENWKKNAEDIYPKILDLLTKNQFDN